MLQSDELPDGCRITRYESIKAKKKKVKGESTSATVRLGGVLEQQQKKYNECVDVSWS